MSAGGGIRTRDLGTKLCSNKPGTAEL